MARKSAHTLMVPVRLLFDMEVGTAPINRPHSYCLLTADPPESSLRRETASGLRAALVLA